MSIKKFVDKTFFVERHCHKEIHKGLVKGPKLDAAEAKLIMHCFICQQRESKKPLSRTKSRAPSAPSDVHQEQPLEDYI